MSASAPKEFAGGAGGEHTSYHAKQHDDAQLLPIPIPRYLLAELPQLGDELPQYVEALIETGKRRSELDTVWLRVISNESKAQLARGDEQMWREVANLSNQVGPLGSLFGGEAPPHLKEQIDIFDAGLEEVDNCIAAAQFTGGSQDDVDTLYNSLKKIMPAFKLIAKKCEDRVRQILLSFDRCTVKIQDAMDRARSVLDATAAEQVASGEKGSEREEDAAGVSATQRERRSEGSQAGLSTTGVTTAKDGE